MRSNHTIVTTTAFTRALPRATATAVLLASVGALAGCDGAQASLGSASTESNRYDEAVLARATARATAGEPRATEPPEVIVMDRRQYDDLKRQAEHAEQLAAAHDQRKEVTAQLNEQIRIAEQAVATLGADNQALLAELGDAEHRVAELETRMEAMSESHADEVRRVRRLLRSERATIRQLRAKLADVEQLRYTDREEWAAEVRRFEGAFEGVLERIREADAEITSLRRLVDDERRARRAAEKDAELALDAAERARERERRVQAQADHVLALAQRWAGYELHVAFCDVRPGVTVYLKKKSGSAVPPVPIEPSDAHEAIELLGLEPFDLRYLDETCNER
jgi:hypothetical protein